LDGSQYFSSERVKCKHCLTATSSGVTRHHHDILQAAIVHPDRRQVLPLAPEFVRNSDGRGGKYHKQDCEINAGYRMLERLRGDYPRMAAIIVADSLYSKQPFIERLRAARFSFPLVAQRGDHKSLFEDVESLRSGNLLAFFMHQIFELVDGLYQRVHTFFFSRRAFWDEVRSAFRLFLFTSWDQVLVRMNSPPVPLSPYQER
ncbi:MAG: hypothetical protein OXE53_09540, partial [Deltaproteobacteria bacterium]|nr:hypothetical protein [Deltaproteobacteria bacterium]